MQRLTWLRDSTMAKVGVGILLAILFCAAFAPLISPYERGQQDVRQQLQAPSADHLMGTDENGADMLTEIIHGARVAVVVGVLTVVLRILLGVWLGLVSGYLGGWVDEVVMRVTEVFMSFPGILLAILIIFITQEPSLWTVIFALSVTGWAGFARLVRGQVLVEREKNYVEAARAAGMPSWRIMVREIAPNCMGPVIVQATFGMAGAILGEATLSFLGLGPQNTASWGALLDRGADYFLISQHIAFFPGLAIMLTVLAINFIGDALRDHFDPRITGRTEAASSN
jgi:peptide/nickel transport system permease protein